MVETFTLWAALEFVLLPLVGTDVATVADAACLICSGQPPWLPGLLLGLPMPFLGGGPDPGPGPGEGPGPGPGNEPDPSDDPGPGPSPGEGPPPPPNDPPPDPPEDEQDDC